MENNYCCKYKCFSTNFDHVDGKACSQCNSYCYCICRCITYKNSQKGLFKRLKMYIMNKK